MANKEEIHLGCTDVGSSSSGEIACLFLLCSSLLDSLGKGRAVNGVGRLGLQLVLTFASVSFSDSSVAVGAAMLSCSTPRHPRLGQDWASEASLSSDIPGNCFGEH